MIELDLAGVSPYSMTDSDLPLLSIDAAYEIEQLIALGANSIDNQDRLVNTRILLDRLAHIANSSGPSDIDSMIYEHSFLPKITGERSLFSKPETIQSKLDSMLGRHEFADGQAGPEFLRTLRDFFIEVSKFATTSRVVYRRSTSLHPNATL
jgi:hypothetical protein